MNATESNQNIFLVFPRVEFPRSRFVTLDTRDISLHASRVPLLPIRFPSRFFFFFFNKQSQSLARHPSLHSVIKATITFIASRVCLNQRHRVPIPDKWQTTTNDGRVAHSPE